MKKLNKVQKEYLDKLIQSKKIIGNLSLISKSKYVENKNYISAEDVNEEQWIEIIQMNDYPYIWKDINQYLITKSL